MTEASQQRSLRQLVGPVGADYQRRVAAGWVWAVLAVLLAATWPTELPATAAAALVSSAVVVHWPQRGRCIGWAGGCRGWRCSPRCCGARMYCHSGSNMAWP